ncbi:uncharacterized protein LOC118436731 [Folsomia candida]|uniref:uncharacterized protein LOC118436731 n=1 Tax=Folsomia candida TaxID=158441 RepID=UPI00160549D4|nr:uncharacterized protein LOC118436731 [Folsomia candida]
MRLLRYVHDMRYVEGQTRNRPNWQNWKPRRGHHVTSLSLTGYIYADADYLLYLDTVSQFKNTLEELSVNVVMDISKNDGPEHQYSQRSELFFPVLKKFSLRLGNHWGRIPATVTTNWMKTWADAVTRVTTIFTDGRVSLGSRFVEEMQKTGTLRYQNLMEISLTCEPEDAINFLRELNQPLKTFLACEIACYTSSH